MVHLRVWGTNRTVRSGSTPRAMQTMNYFRCSEFRSCLTPLSSLPVKCRSWRWIIGIYEYMMNDCRLNLSDIDSHDQIIFTIMCSRSHDLIIPLASDFKIWFYRGSALAVQGLSLTLNLNNVSVELQGGETAEYSSSIVLRDFYIH